MSSDKLVSYCINTFFCSNTINSGHEADRCASCGSKLLVGDRYRLVELLNKENSDPDRIIYRAINVFDDRQYVLKIVDTPKPNARKYLEREYEFLRRVGEPFPSVKDGDYFQWTPDPEQDFFFVYVLVLPFIEGYDSADWVQQHGPISEEKCIDWLKQILVYLEIFADISVIYRDMKPENIVVSDENNLKLIDFGSIRELDQEYLSILEENISDATDIKRGTQIFTFGYSPPEQLRGFAVPQSDFYALGRTVIYWLTGKFPVDLDRSSAPSWETFCDVSETFQNFINWLTENKASARPLSARAIRQYLNHQYSIDLERERYRRKTKFFLNPKVYTLLGVLVGLAGIWLSIAQTLYSQGVGAFQREEYSQAIDKFENVLKLVPIHEGAHYYLGLTCQNQKNADCAIDHYQKVIRFSHNPVAAQYQLGVLHEAEGNYVLAQEFYKASLKTQRQNPDALNRLSRLAEREGNLSKADSYIDEALGYTNSDDPDTLARLFLQKGRIYFQKEEWEKAEEYLIKSAKLKDSADAYCLSAKIAEAKNMDQRIINSFWYDCFYSSHLYPEGDQLRSELLKRAIPELYRDE